MNYSEYVMEHLEQFLLLACITGGIGAATARLRGRDPLFWFFIGALFGLLGIFFLFFGPSRQKKEEQLAYAGGTPTKRLAATPTEGGTQKVNYEWYYLEADETRHGPLSFEALQVAWRTGVLTKETLIWHEELSDWTPIASLDSIVTLLDSDT